MDDVEDLVRTALRDNAAQITQDSLRHNAPPAQRKPATRSALLVAAAFVVAAGGVTAAVTFGGDGLHWGSDAPAYAGSRWNLQSVGGTEVPADLGAYVSFTRGDDFRAHDGVNAMTGHYDGTPTSVRPRDISVTTALYAGDDPVRKAVISAMDELRAQGAQVSVAADQLVVRTGTQEMVFTRGGPATGRGTPVPSR
ncbi:META domain-containing protein [Lentzea sp. NPDC054927]